MSGEKQCYLQRNGKTQGPFSKEKLEASLKAGTLRATDLISVSQDGPWKAIGDVPQLAKLLKPEPAVDLYADLDDKRTPPRKRSKAGAKIRSSPPPVPADVGHRKENDETARNVIAVIIVIVAAIYGATLAASLLT